MDARSSQAEGAFQAAPTSARSARRFVAETLEGWSLASLNDLATLLISELMANVVLHAGTDAVVRLYRLRGRVRVEVSDRSSRLPVRKRYSDGATTGRGLNLVDTLSTDWGVEPTADGKVVWFELAESAGKARGPGDATLDDDLRPELGPPESFGNDLARAQAAQSGPHAPGRDASPRSRQGVGVGR
jgi:anti-sigma regulatory factor (Ser/Thr protein kinase)